MVLFVLGQRFVSKDCQLPSCVEIPFFIIFPCYSTCIFFILYGITSYTRNVRFRYVLCEDEVLAKREGEQAARCLKTIKPGDKRDESLLEAVRLRSQCLTKLVVSYLL